MLRAAGWRPGRSVPTETWEYVLRERGGFVPHPAALRFLAEFGGLVTYGWPADQVTTRAAIRFDPLPAEWMQETFAVMSRCAGAPLYPVGTADEERSFLGIAESGALFLVHESVELLADETDQALDRLVSSQGTASLTCPEVVNTHAFWSRLGATGGEVGSGHRWPMETDRVLRAAGWYPGRSVPTGTWETVLRQTGEYEMHSAARTFLAEFGYLGIPFRAPAGTMPWIEFRLDPLMAMWDAEIIDDLGEQAGADLYPLGMVDRRNNYLAMTEDGAVYSGMDSATLFAPTPDEAMAKLTRPIRRA